MRENPNSVVALFFCGHVRPGECVLVFGFLAFKVREHPVHVYPDLPFILMLQEGGMLQYVLIDRQRCRVFEPSRLLTCNNDDLGGMLLLPVGLPMHVLGTREI